MIDRNLPLQAMTELMDQCGFDSICFARRDPSFGNLIIGSRRGAGAKLAKVPPFVLVPTEQMLGHPCLQGATIAAHDEFT